MKPDFLDMVPWYSGTSADLFKTVFDLGVSHCVCWAFRHAYDAGCNEDLWFDFMADTGDGGNSSYSVAKLLAQPSLRVHSNDSVITLPRSNLLLIGGDLA